jgi:hypothetical protein
VTGLVDFIVGPHPDGRQVLAAVDLTGLLHGPSQEVVKAAQTAPAVVEHCLEQFQHPAIRAVTDQRQRQDQLLQPRADHRQREEHRVFRRSGGLEGPIDDRRGLLHLLVDEFAADLVALGQIRERLGPSQGLQGQVPSLSGGQSGRPAERGSQRWRIAARSVDTLKDHRDSFPIRECSWLIYSLDREESLFFISPPSQPVTPN